MASQINNTPTKLYLYLARRDKKGVQILAIFNGPSVTSRIEDISILGLDPKIEESVRAIIHQNRMYWEPWVEPANTYLELKGKLLKRGYKDLPLAGSPVVDITLGTIVDTSRLSGRKTMIRRGRR